VVVRIDRHRHSRVSGVRAVQAVDVGTGGVVNFDRVHIVGSAGDASTGEDDGRGIRSGPVKDGGEGEANGGCAAGSVGGEAETAERCSARSACSGSDRLVTRSR
jgi:hypothetical protein